MIAAVICVTARADEEHSRHVGKVRGKGKSPDKWHKCA